MIKLIKNIISMPSEMQKTNTQLRAIIEQMEALKQVDNKDKTSLDRCLDNLDKSNKNLTKTLWMMEQIPTISGKL